MYKTARDRAVRCAVSCYLQLPRVPVSKTSRSKVVKELDSTGGLVYNVYGLSRISRTLNGEKAYYLYNGHGDVTAPVNANKTILARYYYDAFGNILEGDINFPNPTCTRVYL